MNITTKMDRFRHRLGEHVNHLADVELCQLFDVDETPLYVHAVLTLAHDDDDGGEHLQASCIRQFNRRPNSNIL